MTQYAYFTGPCKWAKVYKPDDKFGDPIWSIVLYMDEENMENYKKTGMTMKPKTDEDGDYITFRRKQVQNFKNERKEFPPPAVFNKDNEPFSELIGNGSEVTIKVEYFPTRNGVGSRLVSVRVENYVPYAAAEAQEAVAEAQEAVAPANTLPF